MAKKVQTPPCFLLYVKDWLTSQKVCTMTVGQRGAYINLLAHAWLEEPVGSLPNDDHALAHLSGYGDEWNANKIPILNCFELGKDGRLHSKRLQQEYKAWKKRRKSYVDRGKRGADARWHSDSPANSTANAKANAKANAQALLGDSISSSTSSSTSTSRKSSTTGKPVDLSFLLKEGVQKAVLNVVKNRQSMADYLTRVAGGEPTRWYAILCDARDAEPPVVSLKAYLGKMINDGADYAPSDGAWDEARKVFKGERVDAAPCE